MRGSCRDFFLQNLALISNLIVKQSDFQHIGNSRDDLSNVKRFFDKITSLSRKSIKPDISIGLGC